MLLHCRNEPAAAAAATPGPSVRLSMWGRDPAEPTAVPQDGAGSKPHASAEPGPGPTPGSEPGSTSGLPGEHRPQRMAPSCQHLHQQQVGTDDESPDQHDGWSLFFFVSIVDPVCLFTACTPNSPSHNTPHSPTEECTAATTTWTWQSWQTTLATWTRCRDRWAPWTLSRWEMT